jgi:hypothetical protein
MARTTLYRRGMLSELREAHQSARQAATLTQVRRHLFTTWHDDWSGAVQDGPGAFGTANARPVTYVPTVPKSFST